MSKMSINDEMRKKFDECDLVLICPNKLVYSIALFLTRLVFPVIEFSPLAPVVGYKGEIYKEDEINLAKILLKREYTRGCVLFRDLKYHKKRLDDILELVKTTRAGRYFIRYSIVSVSGVLINMILFYIMYGLLRIWDMLSLSISIELSILITFFLNNYWALSGRDFHKPLWRRLFGYHLVLFIGMVINLGVYYLLSLAKVEYMTADFLGIVIASIWNMYMIDVHVFFAEKPKNKKI